MRCSVANIFAILCAVVASLLLALSARSLSQHDSLYFEWGGRGYFLSSARGQLGMIQTSRPFGIATWNFGSYATRDRDPLAVLELALSDDATNRWGIVCFGSGNINPTSQFMGTLAWLAIPVALPIVLLYLPAGLRIQRRLRNRSRQARNLCLVCGYDMRATPDQCPECGNSVIVAAPATTA
jgi:hypothetical protein